MNNRVLSILLTCSILVSSCGTQTIEKNDPVVGKSVKTQIIQKDYFSEKIKLVGKVSPIMETPISSLASGIIKNINSEVGKKVKSGQLLAKLDLSTSIYGASFNNAQTALNNSLNSFSYTEESIKNDLEAAKIQLENAKTAKENTYTTTEKQLELSQTQLDNIRKNSSNLEITTSESLKNAQLLLDNSNTNLENFKKNSEENLNSIYENLKVALSSAVLSIDTSINQADMLLGVTEKNKNANDSYEIYLGAKDASTKVQAENIFRELKSSWDSFNSNSYSTSRESLEKKSNDILSLINKDLSLYDNVVRTLNNSITSSTFTQTQIDNLNLNASKNQAAIIQAQSQLTGLKNTLSTTKSSIDTNLVSLNNAISIAKAQLENIKAGNNSQLDSISGNENLTQAQLENTNATVKQTRDSVDNAVKIAQANYDSINAKLNSQRVQAKAQIDSAKGGKDLASISLNNTSIEAPFSGIITARNIEVGTMVNPGTPVFMIGDDSQLKIKLDVDSDNITYLKLGQDVQVTKGDKTFSGIISLLSPAADPTTKMFKVEVSFDKKPDFNIGDYVDVFINKEKGSDKILQVPYSSVVSLGQGDYSVFVVGNDKKAKLKSVKLGDQNSTMVEIISGINEGEKVVIGGSLNLQDGDLIEESK